MTAKEFKPILLAKFPYLCKEGLDYIDAHIEMGSTLEEVVSDSMTLERYFMYLSALGMSRDRLYNLMLSLTDDLVEILYDKVVTNDTNYLSIKDRLISKERFKYDYTDIFSLDDGEKAPKILLCIVLISYPFKVINLYPYYEEVNELIVKMSNRMMSPVIIGNSSEPRSKFVGA